MPNPRIPLPVVSVPTVLLFTGGLMVWIGATWLVVNDAAPLWVTIPLHALVTFTMFTVLHEATHHAAGQLTWVNELLGRLAMPFVAGYGSFPLVRYIHLEHHRNTNEDAHTDPDAWTAHGPWWQLPLRWLTIDFWYARFYVARQRSRPPSERIETAAVVALSFAAFAWLTVSGHGWELLVAYLVPQRVGLAVLAWWFDWLPHHDLGEQRQNRFGATRVRVGLEWLMTPIMLCQNYHLVHHLHPAIPFYRYLRAWRDNRDAYLARDVPIATAWGRELTSSEYREWRQLTGSFDEEPPAPQPRPPGRFHSLRVSEVRPLCEGAVTVTFDVPERLRETFRFTPGQHLVIRAEVDGLEMRRAYSICSTPESGVLRIAIKHQLGGAFSTFATTELEAGDVLEVLPPDGVFTLTPARNRSGRYVALAAGSGITPILSILTSTLRNEPSSKATLLYINTSGASTMFAAELGALATQLGGRLHVVHYRTDERDPDLRTQRLEKPFDIVGEALAISHERYQRGRLDSTRLRALLQARLHPAKVDEWFLCGPRDLVDMARRTLSDRDVPEENVHFELFQGALPVRPSRRPGPALTVTAGGKTAEIPATVGETVLGAALRHGVDAPYACMGGACGTCRATVVRGSARMDVRYALGDEDVAAGRILTCRAVATSPELDVDYDR
ncbi:fatty acid desaturase [Amycolatopsis thailandensis]|uniref:fatty acid desaturase n=1 Tax=Amycolatopsis thailandensis TaxID=589330 RepID=UPI0036428AA8